MAEAKRRILPLAKQDILEASKWYNEQKQGLGKRFSKAVRSKLKVIQRNPKLFQIRFDKIRMAKTDTFPYKIHYEFDENSNTVIISGVYYAGRDPEVWKER